MRLVRSPYFAASSTPTGFFIRKSWLALGAIAGMGVTVTGCGPDCQSTCNKLYSQNECNIQRAGAERQDLLDECSDRCEVALTNPGEADPDYNPADKMRPSQTQESSIIETDTEAAMWMDCVEETACDLLDEGYCWGIGL